MITVKTLKVNDRWCFTLPLSFYGLQYKQFQYPNWFPFYVRNLKLKFAWVDDFNVCYYNTDKSFIAECESGSYRLIYRPEDEKLIDFNADLINHNYTIDSFNLNVETKYALNLAFKQVLKTDSAYIFYDHKSKTSIYFGIWSKPIVLRNLKIMSLKEESDFEPFIVLEPVIFYD